MRRRILPFVLPVLAVCGALTAACLRGNSAIAPVSSHASSGRAIAPNLLSATAALQQVRGERDAYYLNAQREVYRSVREVLLQREEELDRGLRFTKLYHGNLTRKQIALTFDDGPHLQSTPKILDILKKENVKATFFLVGSQAERHPDLVRAEAAEGHMIANHTYHHVSLTKIPQEYVADEIKACGMVLKTITGKAPRFFRPPGGEYNTDVAEASEALGYTMVLWTDDPADYASPGADVILQRTMAKAANGGIILVHDGIPQTIEILPQLIERLKAQGYEFVTIDEMARSRHQSVAPPVDGSSTIREAQLPLRRG